MSVDDKFSMVASESHIVVSLLDPIKATNWDAIERVGTAILEQVQGRKAPKIAFDLTDLDYMGSSVVALMVRVWKETQVQDGMMVVVTRHTVVREVITLAGLGRYWTIVDTLEEAFDALGVSDAAVVQRRETRLLTFVGPAAAVGASAGLAVLLNAVNQPQEYIGVIGAFGCSLLAICTSGVSVFRESGGKRTLSLAVVIWSVAVLAYATKYANENPPDVLKNLMGNGKDEVVENPDSSVKTQSQKTDGNKTDESKTEDQPAAPGDGDAPDADGADETAPDGGDDTGIDEDSGSENSRGDDDSNTGKPTGPPQGIDLNPDGSDRPTESEDDKTDKTEDESADDSGSPEARADELILPPDETPRSESADKPTATTDESASPEAPPLPEKA